ncbi:MAG: TlpA family protein disulfide reductase [Bacteroidia bacterium]|nr:TlpA family protein disulfide reductase [Bacteroidia bacterium]
MNEKKILILLFFILLNSFKSYTQDTATISGIVENPASDSIQLTIDRLYLNKKAETIPHLLDNGKFTFNCALEQSRMVELSSGNIHLKVFIESNDNLLLQIKNNSVSFSGSGSEQNTFLHDFYSQFKTDFDDSLAREKMLTTGIDAFEISIFESRKKQKEFLKKSVEGKKFSSGFTEFMENTISYRYWNLLLSYPIINANSNKGMIVNALPRVMLDGFDKIKVSNETALNCESYREFLKYYVIYFTSEKNGFKKFTDLSLSAERKSSLAKERLSGSPYKFWLAGFLMDECSRLSPFMVKKLFNELKTVDKANNYTVIVNEICGEKMAMKEEKIKNEKTSGTNDALNNTKDELDLTDVNGKHVALSNFKGKVVYIDFWASWCGPCRAMMPYSKQLHDQLSDKYKKKIVFLYISIDAAIDRWKKGIEELGIEGVNVNSPGNWTSKACSYFQINSIPRYMIMNKKGEIVDFNAKRPADPAVSDDLMKYADE